MNTFWVVAAICVAIFLAVLIVDAHRDDWL